MAELLRGSLAETEAQAQPTPPRPFRIRDSGRLAADASRWTRPLPPLLWQRLDDEQRQAHERAVETYGQQAGKARELAAKARQQAADDEQALREAVASGSRPPKAKAPGLEAAAAEAQRAQEMAGRIVLESGGAIAEPLSDDDLRDAIAEARARGAEIVAATTEHVEQLHALFAEAGQLGGEAQYAGRLLERRTIGPWTGSSAPLSHRLAAAAQHAHELRVYVDAELSEQAHRDAPPPEHHAPRGAPAVDSWTSSPVDPTR